MLSAASLPSLLLAAAAVAASTTKYGELETVHEWTRLDFDWASSEEREAAINNSEFVPEYCVLVDVKAVDGEVFVTVPRIRHGVPASVNRVKARGNDTVLSPYPSWEMNRPGKDCRGVQNAYAIEIDTMRRMWIVDSGSRDTFSRPVNDCPPKILVWDMVKNREVRRFEFPPEVVASHGVILRGVVLDTAEKNPEDWFAYIADTGKEQVLVYSWRENAAWNVTHAETMKYDISAIAVQVGRDQESIPTAIDSLAISPRGAAEPRLFFAAVSSFNFYSIQTAFLRNRTRVSQVSPAELDSEISRIGTRVSQSEGMTVSDSGVMFYSVLNGNAINQWNTSAPFSAMDQVYRDDTRLQWTSSFGWDGGFLYVVSDRWHKTAMLNLGSSDEVMYRLLRARVDMDGYMGPYQRGQRVGVGAAPARAATAALALLCAAFAAAAV